MAEEDELSYLVIHAGLEFIDNLQNLSLTDASHSTRCNKCIKVINSSGTEMMERNLGLKKTCKCVCVLLTCAWLLYLMFLFGFNGQVHHYVAPA